MPQYRNVITNQERMYNYTPIKCDHKILYPPKSIDSIYIYKKTNQEHENESGTRNEANQTKQEQ